MIYLLLFCCLYGFEFVSKCLISRAKLDRLFDISKSAFEVFGGFLSLSTQEVGLGSLVINVECLRGLVNGCCEIA